MKTVDVSVLMPVYNAEKYLPQAIESILNQSFSDFEFVIVNDGSTDRSEEIILSYKDARIKLINQKNGGVSNALNTGLKNASGKYVARMDADDIAYPDRLWKQYAFLQNNPEYILVGSNADYIEENGDFIFKYEAKYYHDEAIKKQIQHDCLFIHTAAFYVREVIINAGMYPERAHSFEDHLLWANLSDKGKYCILEESLVAYRFNPSSVTVDFKDYDDHFMAIKVKALKTGEISTEEEQVLLSCLKKLDKTKKVISYHRLLAKKYLWNNYNPKKARKNLRKVIALSPSDFTSYMLFGISFMPKKVISYIYAQLKK